MIILHVIYARYVIISGLSFILAIHASPSACPYLLIIKLLLILFNWLCYFHLAKRYLLLIRRQWLMLSINSKRWGRNTLLSCCCVLGSVYTWWLSYYLIIFIINIFLILHSHYIIGLNLGHGIISILWHSLCWRLVSLWLFILLVTT